MELAGRNGHQPVVWSCSLLRTKFRARATRPLIVPARRASLPPPKTPPLRAPRKPAIIENQRQKLFAELMQLRELPGTSARSIETARTLLTKWWAKATWRKREQLIKSADWLIRLECTRAVQEPRA
jgi:hypothetical protein